MNGLIEFAQAVVPGSARVIASVSNEQNALLMLTVEADFGAGPVTLPAARLYRSTRMRSSRRSRSSSSRLRADAPTGRGGMAPPRPVFRMRAAK
jgi:hypothetical protein